MRETWQQGMRGLPYYQVWRSFFGWAGIGLAWALSVGLTDAEAQLQLPSPVGYVNDFAGVIPDADAQRMERLIDEVRAKSGGEIVVVTLPSLEGRTRDEVALQIGREWAIGRVGEPGDAARNTGAVILVA
ncbi:MAG: TPM domain-containing protein, partial [Gemmatimonadota bacterium]